MVDFQMLLWLVDAAGVPHQSVAATLRDCANATSTQRRSGDFIEQLRDQLPLSAVIP